MGDGPAKYEYISRKVREEIERGSLKPGMRVPSENEIRATYDVSNTTARKALQDLELQGYAKRIKGKGTFVRDRSVVRAADRILSFTKNIRQSGREPRTTVLYAGLVDAGYSVEILDHTYHMEGPIYKVHRLRFADDVPVLLEVRYISAELCPGLDQRDLSGSLYGVYRDAYGLHLTEVKQSLSATMLDASAMHFFNVGESSPGILLESVTFCGKDRPLEMERSIYRGDVYKFYVAALERSDQP